MVRPRKLPYWVRETFDLVETSKLSYIRLKAHDLFIEFEKGSWLSLLRTNVLLFENMQNDIELVNTHRVTILNRVSQKYVITWIFILSNYIYSKKKTDSRTNYAGNIFFAHQSCPSHQKTNLFKILFIFRKGLTSSLPGVHRRK